MRHWNKLVCVALVVFLMAGLPAFAQSRVSSADSTDNRLTQDVIGNKTDAAATTAATTKSIVAYLKGALALIAAQDTSGGGINDTTTDSVHGKIGTDTEMSDISLFDMLGLNTAATTDSINGKIGTDGEMSDASLFDMITAQNVLVGTIDLAETDNLHGKIGTDTEMGDASLFDMITSQNVLVGTIDLAETDNLHGKIGTDAEMSDASLFDMLTSQNTSLGTIDLTTTDNIHGKIGTDTEMGDASLYDMITSQDTLMGAVDDAVTSSLHGKIGTDTEMGDTSIFDYLMPVEVVGETDMDEDQAVYTNFITLLTIVPAAGQSLIDLVIDIDYNKASTGWDNVATAADVLDVSIVTKTDGTNWRHVMSGNQITANGNGTLENNEDGERFHVGMVGINGEVEVRIRVDTERGDVEFPYRVIYRGAAPTITEVSAI